MFEQRPTRKHKNIDGAHNKNDWGKKKTHERNGKTVNGHRKSQSNEIGGGLVVALDRSGCVNIYFHMIYVEDHRESGERAKKKSMCSHSKNKRRGRQF